MRFAAQSVKESLKKISNPSWYFSGVMLNDDVRCARDDVVHIFLRTHVRSKGKVVAMVICLGQETR